MAPRSERQDRSRLAQPRRCSGTIPEWKIGPFLDFTMTGRFDADGQKITGGTRGSGFHGEPFSLVKE